MSKGETAPECIVIPTAGQHYVQYAGLASKDEREAERRPLRRRDHEPAAQFAALNAIRPGQPLYCQNCDAKLKPAAVRCHYCGSEDLAAGVPPPAGIPVPGATRQITGLAIASMVLGVAGILLTPVFGFGAVFGLPAIILGHVARWKLRRTAKAGAGAALAGLVLGYLAVTAGVFIWVALGISCYGANAGKC